MKFSQKGFAALEALLILVIVAIIGGTGWYVVSSKNDIYQTYDNTTNYSSARTDKKTSTNVDTSNYEGVIYKPPNGQYSVKIPNGWTLHRYQNDSALFAFGSKFLNYDSAVAAKVIVDEGGRDGSAVGFFLSYSDKPNDFRDQQGSKTADLQTDNGANISEYYYKETQDINGLGALPKDGVDYAFLVTNNKASIEVHYGIAPGETDQHDLVTQLVKTIQFK